MEHRLILGGEHFLPFARSCIAKLKKLGLPYANQSFEIDGVSIKVRVEPGHEYIRIEGGCSLGIDSGVAELWPTSTGVVEYWDPVYLYETADGAAYNAKFTENTPGIPTDDSRPETRSNPDKGSSGHIAGLLTYSGAISGSMPSITSRARSFAPYVALSSGDNPRWEFAKRDENAWEKKSLVVECPASIFTGRCRAYVQSAYGAYLYADPHKPGSVYRPFTLKKIYGVAPRLVVMSYVRKNDDATYPEIVITTSSGIYLDKGTGSHWLINPSDTDTVTVYPLVSSKCGEGLRRILVKPLKGMTQADVDRVEAYILAYSLPDPKNSQALMIVGSKHSPNAMGYGWHWNYSGTTADRVILTNYRQDRPDNWVYPPGPEWDPWGVESVHSRITLSVSEGEDGSVSFSIGTSQISSSKWAVNRGSVVIIEPSWNDFAKARKSTPSLSAPFTSSGTFYVFYTGDALQLCTVSVSETPTVDATFESSDPLYANGVPDGVGNIEVNYYGRSYGFRGGSYKHVSKQGWHHTVSITVGPVTHSGLVIGQHKDGVEDVMSAKTLASPPTSWSTPTVWLYGSYHVGDPMNESGGTVVVLEDLSVIAGRSREVATGYGMLAEFDVDRHNYTIGVSSSSVVAASGTDSEAVFIQSEKNESRFDSGYIKATRQSDKFISAIRITDISTSGSSAGPPILDYLWWDNSATSEVSTPVEPKTTTTQLFKASQLVCAAGVLTCNDDWDLSPTVWYYKEDFTFEYFPSIAGANKTAVIPLKKYRDPVGFSTTLLDPAFVGYA